MTRAQIQGYAGVPIRSFDDWESHALPPARKKLHWKPDRSACELGRIWTADGEPTVPRQLTQLLESHEGTRSMLILSGITERETPLPFGNRGPRCHDLALKAEQNGRVVTICIEAKADESFGGTITEELSTARKRVAKRKGSHTRFPERLDWLTHSLLGLRAFEDAQHQVLTEAVADLPYQVLPAIAGTLLEAERQKACKAVFIVHEFRTAKTADANLDANANALNRFLRVLLPANGTNVCQNFTLENGQIVGPILIAERPVIGAERISPGTSLFIGKIRTDLLGKTQAIA